MEHVASQRWFAEWGMCAVQHKPKCASANKKGKKAAPKVPPPQTFPPYRRGYRTLPAFHADSNCSYFTVSPFGFSLASFFHGAC